jgi:hypothetical protein
MCVISVKKENILLITLLKEKVTTVHISFENHPIQDNFLQDSSCWRDYYYNIDKDSLRVQL